MPLERSYSELRPVFYSVLLCLLFKPALFSDAALAPCPLSHQNYHFTLKLHFAIKLAKVISDKQSRLVFGIHSTKTPALQALARLDPERVRMFCCKAVKDIFLFCSGQTSSHATSERRPPNLPSCFGCQAVPRASQ